MLRDFATVVSLSLKQLRHFYGSKHLFPKIFMFSLRYINCLCNLSRLPLGEGAERSEAEGGNASYVFKIYEGELLCRKIKL